MATSYPIWVVNDSDAYPKPRSFGAKDNVTSSVLVGTSKVNSRELVQHCTEKEVVGIYFTENFGECELYRYSFKIKGVLNTDPQEWHYVTSKYMISKARSVVWTNSYESAMAAMGKLLPK